MIRNQWYAVLPCAAVSRNRIVAVKRLNLDLALFRNDEGVLGCVVDQCTHRGAQLSKGKVTGACLSCPFHGLAFAADGKCAFIPANGRVSSENISRYNVKSYTVREAYGIIYLWYGDDDKVAPELPFFPDFVDGSYAYSEIEDHWNAHYSRCIENQLDVVHVPIVHYNTIGRGNKTLINGPRVEFTNGTLITSANNEVDTGQKPKSAGECVIKPTYLALRYPNLWMNHISPRIKVIIFFAPVDQENTMLYIRFYCKLTGLRLINRAIAFMGKYANRIIERQDKRVVVTQKPKASSLVSGEKLLRGDGPIILYRKLREELKKAGAV